MSQSMRFAGPPGAQGAVTRRCPWLVLLLGGLLLFSAPLSAQASRDTWKTDFSRHTVPLDEIVSGGPQKDGIPALDNPRFESVEEADGWLADQDPVAVVRLEGETRAYPLQILIWHEIVNDRVVTLESAGSPLAIPFSVMQEERVLAIARDAGPWVVFWAPGTSSALDAARIPSGRNVGSTAVYASRIDGRSLTFEAAGDGLFRDRETGSLWSLSGDALEGPMAGESLEPIPLGNHFWFAWAVFKPETRIIR